MTGHPRFSPGEMLRRRAVLDDVLAAAGVEHVLLYGANRSGSAVQWLTRWPVTREGVVVHTPGEQDLLLVQFYNHVPNATRMADAEVRWGGPSTVGGAVDELRGRGAGTSTRVGVIGPMSFGDHARLTGAVGAVVDLDPAYTGLRLSKSAEELAWLRRAAELTDASAAALRDGLRIGHTEHDLVRLVEDAYLAEGGSNHIHYLALTSMAQPQRTVPAQWPTGRRVRPGDLLAFELSTAWGVDYPGQLLRTFTIGAPPTARVAELHAVADEALTRVEALLRPGVTPAEIVEAASVIEDAGFTTVDDLVHGLGGGYLPPVLGSRSRTLTDLPDLALREGMTIVVQPNVTDGTIGVQTGEMFHVTARSSERLHDFPRSLSTIAADEVVDA